MIDMETETSVLVTNLSSAAIIGNRVLFEDYEGTHIGTVKEVWQDQNIAVVDGREGQFDCTWFVPLHMS